MTETALTVVDRFRALLGHAEDPTGKVKTYMEQAFLNRQARVVKAATDAMAADTTAEYSFFTADRSYRVVSVKYIPRSAVTAGATHFATCLVDKRPASGPGTPVNVATRSLAATNMVAFTEESWTLTVTAADLLLVTGDQLTFEITKTMNGLAVPAGVVTVNMVEV
jgi:hypothetical protein